MNHSCMNPSACTKCLADALRVDPPAACKYCDNGQVWDPRVHGNVVSCFHCDGSGLDPVIIGIAEAEAAYDAWAAAGGNDQFKAVVHDAMKAALQGDPKTPSAYSERVAVALTDLDVGVNPIKDFYEKFDAVVAADAELKRTYAAREHAGSAYAATVNARVALADCVMESRGYHAEV